ncbi:glycosyl hydrolase [Salibacteraceae bacterium]|jgi:photosystem II stability/assembly factor-like uncharacterized protein|nr:glycosyl hydrolase [Salibacteraceae bacterium]
MNRALIIGLLMATPLLFSAKGEKEKEDSSKVSYSALKFRAVGPALTSGRVVDIAVHPEKPTTYYVAAAAGGVWKTENSGTSFSPIFDGEGSYSIGCVALNPSNLNEVWVGSGENNNQRSVAYGDGVYKSQDGGKSWKNMGLKNSEHIGMIKFHPNDPQTVYVAAVGPLWSAGGDRGLYKTTNGGESWKRILEIDEHTGVHEIHIDPRNPDVMYAAAHQRRRHVWTYISGGPSSAIYKSEDGGVTWNVLENGIPKGDKGRIGMAMAPSNPDVLYAMVEGTEKTEGFFRSTDRGASWSKLNKYNTSGNYYTELYVDPLNSEKIFSMDTWCHMSLDGGKTWNKINEKYKHVDNHCMWINPENTDHYIMGCDGGLYTSFDDAKSWSFHANLPITQFYKVAVDQDAPFYNIYGGTQDNFSIGGPSRTNSTSGIVNADWFITKGGDGFESQVDPTDPNIVYAQSQYGWLVRFDKRSGEKVDIKPQPGKGEAAFRWNWDAPLLISPHNPNRLYFCANKVFRSDDRGDNWTTISGDLSRQLDRNKLEVMDRVWSVDAVAKNKSTSIYGQIVAFDESPKKEGLLYIGTDDGLIHVSKDGGKTWTKKDGFPGIPARTYVNSLTASRYDENTVFATFNNHKQGDFKPYILKSTDAGSSWTSISGNLPERGSVYDLVQDNIDAKLLFAGTEFGCFFSQDGGAKWQQLNAGLPTVAVRDIEIQERENDLVLASFGRGFYVLDDYSALRFPQKDLMEKDAHIFSVRDAWLYIESTPLGLRKKAFQGNNFFSADNPPMGPQFTWYMKEAPKSKRDARLEKEKETAKSGGDNFYPSEEALREEDRENDPTIVFTIRDAAGKVVSKFTEKPKKGVNRSSWNMRYGSMSAIQMKKEESDNPFAGQDYGALAFPGKYSVEMTLVQGSELKALAGPIEFQLKALDNMSMPMAEPQSLAEFKEEVKEAKRKLVFTNKKVGDLSERMKFMRQAILSHQRADISWLADLTKQQELLDDQKLKLYGDGSLSKREFETAPSINGRIGLVTYNLWSHRSNPTGTQRVNIQIATEELLELEKSLETIETSIAKMEEKMAANGVPYTPGRDETE